MSDRDKQISNIGLSLQIGHAQKRQHKTRYMIPAASSGNYYTLSLPVPCVCVCVCAVCLPVTYVLSWCLVNSSLVVLCIVLPYILWPIGREGLVPYFVGKGLSHDFLCTLHSKMHTRAQKLS